MASLAFDREPRQSAAAPGEPLSGLPSDAQDPARVRLKTLITIRWIAVAGQLATLLIVHFALDFAFDLGFAIAAVAVSAALNLYLARRFPATKQLSDAEAATQLGFDLLQLALLLYLTGGLTNPFSLLMLVPVTISATILSRRSTAVLLLVALALSLVLALWHQPLPWRGMPVVIPETYLAGVWIGLCFSMVFLALYVARVSSEARRRATALAATQAALSREHRLAALGTLAAAAAHELGTPLGTITLAARELEQETPPDDPKYEDVALIASQARRCRQILERIGKQRVAGGGDPFAHQRISALVREAARPYEELSDTAILVRSAPRSVDGPPQPVVRRRPEILHALGNFIENAVSFARSRVLIDISWSYRVIEVAIEDDGPGFVPSVLRSLGEPYVTTRGGLGEAGGRDGGLGLGVFIAKTLLERTGARVSFVNAKGGGALVRITWPVEALLTQPDTGTARSDGKKA